MELALTQVVQKRRLNSTAKDKAQNTDEACCQRLDEHENTTLMKIRQRRGCLHQLPHWAIFKITRRRAEAQQPHLAKFELPRCRHLRPHLGRALAKRIRCACAMCRQVTHALLMLQGNCTHHHVIAMRELLEGWAA